MAKLKYLVAVDHTEEAEDVIAAARKFADGMDAELACITVIHPMVLAYGHLDIAGYSQNIVDLEEQAHDLAKLRLLGLAAEYRVDPSNVHICRGNPAMEIRAMANELGSDMIVIGTHARHGLGLLLGSTANAVLHGIGCDALVVRVH